MADPDQKDGQTGVEVGDRDRTTITLRQMTMQFSTPVPIHHRGSALALQQQHRDPGTPPFTGPNHPSHP
ncbi:MAG TPA: hypothetical protein VEH82_12025 [Acidimicrobiales bacterium]|nr:hypothetical protein [Acidimicrobiales bacterium]